MKPPPPVRIETVKDFLRVVDYVGPLVPVSIAAAFQGVSRQAVYKRAAARWLVDGMVLVPLGRCPFSSSDLLTKTPEGEIQGVQGGGPPAS